VGRLDGWNPPKYQGLVSLLRMDHMSAQQVTEDSGTIFGISIALQLSLHLQIVRAERVCRKDWKDTELGRVGRRRRQIAIGEDDGRKIQRERRLATTPRCYEIRLRITECPLPSILFHDWRYSCRHHHQRWCRYHPLGTIASP